ncbi:MAG: FAD:protein FMN transferase [Bacteroidetes bacterium]|nr:FAD:protein FMN transferase [Bacteroidota bacterium]
MKKFYWLSLIFFLACNSGEKQLVKLEGKTMGTTYHISYLSSDKKDMSSNSTNFQTEIDSLLVEFNNSVSTYIPSSTISKVNKPDTMIEVDEYFVEVFRKAQDVSEKTDGAFDITVMPLVNGWGFGYTDTIRMDSAVVDSLQQLVGYRNIGLIERNEKYFVRKKDKRIQVDFSAIAKGYGVDLVGMLLEERGIENYMAEIGGEVRAKGKNEKGEVWRIGVEKPIDDPSAANHELKDILKLENKSLATSGNYRNFYYRNGKKVSHEIDPMTGYPALNNLLSVTVIADDCMTADAFATAFMVMGLEKTLNYLQKDSTLNVYLIYADEKGEMKVMMTSTIKGVVVP